MSRPFRIVLATLAIGLLATALALFAVARPSSSQASSGSHRGIVIRVRHASGHARIHVQAPSTQADSLLSSIIAGLDQDRFASASVGAPEDGVKSDGSWITVAMSGGDDALERAQSYWEGQLAVGAYRDLAPGAGVVADTGYAISYVEDDGTPASSVGDMGGLIGPLPKAPPTPYTQSELTSTIEKGMDGIGLNVKSITFLKPDQLAPLVVATTSDDPRSFLKAGHSVADVFGDIMTYEGIGVELEDSNGSPFLFLGIAPRTGITNHWIRPDVEAPQQAPIPSS